MLLTIGFYGIVIILGVIVAYAIGEQINYQRKKGNLPGPRGITPLVGGLIKMLFNPYEFWDMQGKYGKISTNSLFGQFVVFSSDTDVSRKIFMNNDPSKLKIILHPNAEMLLGKDNIAFLQAEAVFTSFPSFFHSPQQLTEISCIYIYWFIK